MSTVKIGSLKTLFSDMQTVGGHLIVDTPEGKMRLGSVDGDSVHLTNEAVDLIKSVKGTAKGAPKAEE